MIKGLQAQRRSEWGFTLIEVMVVIIMIGILAAIAVPIYSGYVYRARASEGVTTMGAIKTYLLERANATGIWPTLAELNTEFKDFKELYYFNPLSITLSASAGQPILNSSGTYQNPTIEVKIDTAPSTFGATGDLRLRIDLNLTDNVDSGGWGGVVRNNWATHLRAFPTT